MDYLLPIGSLIWVDKKPLMIIGYFTKKENEVFDYTCTIYPIGISNGDLLFCNHDQIEKVIFIGFQNNHTDEFNKQMLLMRDLYNSGKSDEEITKEIKGVTVNFENI